MGVSRRLISTSWRRDGKFAHHVRRYRVMRAAGADSSGFTAVLIGNAYIEYYLRNILRATLPDPNAFLQNSKGEDVHYDFADLLKLVVAMKALRPGDYAAIKAFASLRNVFAHNPDARLSDHRALLRKLVVALAPEAAEKFDKRLQPDFQYLMNAVWYFTELAPLQYRMVRNEAKQRRLLEAAGRRALEGYIREHPEEVAKPPLQLSRVLKYVRRDDGGAQFESD